DRVHRERRPRDGWRLYGADTWRDRHAGKLALADAGCEEPDSRRMELIDVVYRGARAASLRHHGQFPRVLGRDRRLAPGTQRRRRHADVQHLLRRWRAVRLTGNLQSVDVADEGVSPQHALFRGA